MFLRTRFFCDSGSLPLKSDEKRFAKKLPIATSIYKKEKLYNKTSLMRKIAACSLVFARKIQQNVEFFLDNWNGCGIMYDRMEAETYLVSGAYSKFVLQA